MFRIRDVSRAALIVCAGSLAGVGFAQTQTQTPAPELKRVEVTGSRIKRIDSETASPVQVITRDQIERSGATTITDVLRNVPASNTGGFSESAVASFTPGAGGVSLRGLGAQATLILINGRRVAPFGFASGGQQTFVDVNSIPLDAVERIETLLDGASAVYGSDAIAGVVNIILRKDFNGFTASASFGQSVYKDANSPAVALTYGKGSLATDGYNVFANFSHNERSAVKASARPNTATGDFSSIGIGDLRSSRSYPGNLYTNSGTNGGAFLGPAAGCAPTKDGSALDGRCVYDATRFADIIPKTKRDALFFAGTVDLGGGTEIFGDASFMSNKFSQQSPSYSTSTYGPAGTGTMATNTIILPVGHPNNPYPQQVQLRYRFADVPFMTDVTSNTQRAVLGVRGNWLGWDAESALLLSRSNTDFYQSGFIRDSVLLNEVLDANGVAKPSFVFGNPAANDPGLMARLYPLTRNNGTTATNSIDFKGSRDLMQLAGGPLGFAVGAEFRQESFVSTPDPLISAGEFSVIGASSANGSRTISALYAELSAPLLKSLEASLAARMDRYSDFGNATTPKASVKWKATPQLAFRATYSEGFRAPALTETSQSPTMAFISGIRDPKLCPVADQNNTNCDLSLSTVSGSNPLLKPERSKSFTYGLVYEPLDNLSITIDTYNIKRTDEIASIDPDYLLANEAIYPGYVVRDASGVIKSLNLQYTNLGSTHVMGYDVDIKSRLNLGEYGKLTIEGVFNAEPNYLVSNVAGAPEVEYAGTYTQPTQRWKLGFTWETGPWTSSLTYNRTGGYLRAYTPADLSCPYSGQYANLCAVAAYGTADVFVGYKGFKNLDLGLSIQNISNEQPPIDERMATRYTLFNHTFSSALDRFITLSAKYTF